MLRTSSRFQGYATRMTILQDMVFIGIAVVFFGLSAALVRFFDRLMG